MRKFKITQEQVEILKRCAAVESVPSLEPKSVLLEPGFRYNTEIEGKPVSMNIALVSDDSSWNDTDLDDYGTWAEFRKGVELTEDGRATIDFYIRRRGCEYGELHGNVTLQVFDGEMDRIVGYGPRSLRWSKETGFVRG